MRWTLSRKIAFVILVLVFLFPILIMSFVPQLFVIILFSVLLGCLSWYVMGKITPSLAMLYYRMHRKTFSKSPDARSIVLIKNQSYTDNSYWARFYRALVESFFPTIIAFSIVGYILRNAGSVNDPKVFMVLLSAPAVVSFLIPIKIMRDSRMYYIDQKNKEIISLCRELYIRLKSFGGLLALGLFLLTLYSVTEGIRGVFMNLLVYFSFIYPAITLTFFVYFDRWHGDFTSRINSKARHEGLKRYIVALTKS